MTRKLVVINGKGGSGKDTFIKCCGYISNWNIYSFSSVALIKKAAKILGWNEEKNPDDRKFLSDLKQLSINYNNQPNEYLIYCVSKMSEYSLGFVHIREPKEINVFRSSFVKETKIYTLLVDRFGERKKFGNVSDDKANVYNYDYVVYNKGIIEELIGSSKKFLNWLEVPYDEKRYIEMCNPGSWNVHSSVVSDKEI